jgi:UDP-N-acetylglucosamine 4-epimerase
LENIAQKLRGKHVLITGGAGFIGSNIAGELIENGIQVTVLDNLATGRLENIQEFSENPLFSFIEGDIRNMEDCSSALEGIDVICHQAALGSVPRSIEFPHMTHEVNATGFLNMLHAAKEKGIKRFVYASSSSVYGDSPKSPKFIGDEGELLSPYAVTKSLNEQYAKVYKRLHNSQTIGLRYFNVYGPKQDPNGVYAAAIPKFLNKMIQGEEIVVHGDGEQTRDFTFVKNAVKANLLALTTTNENAFGKAYNVACGDAFSLNYVLEAIQSDLTRLMMYNNNTSVVYGPERKGDIKDSLASIEATTVDLGYKEPILFSEGIQVLCEWIRKRN